MPGYVRGRWWCVCQRTAWSAVTLFEQELLGVAAISVVWGSGCCGGVGDVVSDIHCGLPSNRIARGGRNCKTPYISRRFRWWCIDHDRVTRGATMSDLRPRLARARWCLPIWDPDPTWPATHERTALAIVFVFR